MKIKRRIGRGGGSNSSGAIKCPDFFELESGDFVVIGEDVTSQFSNLLVPGDSSILGSERAILLPRFLAVSAKNDLPNE